MLLQVVKELSLVENMNEMIDIKVSNLSNPKSKHFVDPVPACHHLFIVIYIYIQHLFNRKIYTKDNIMLLYA